MITPQDPSHTLTRSLTASHPSSSVMHKHQKENIATNATNATRNSTGCSQCKKPNNVKHNLRLTRL